MDHDVPNACNTCHQRVAPGEMQSAMSKWWPDVAQRQARRTRLANAIDEKTASDSLASLQAVVHDNHESGILRGACALLLGQRFPSDAGATIAPLLDDSDPLVRADFIEALGHARASQFAGDIARHLDDSAVQVRQMAAMVLTSFGDPRGVQALQRLANDPATTTLVRPHMMLANQFMRRGNLDGAAAELRKVLDVMPYVPDALVMLADIDVRQGHREAARADLEEALRFNPAHDGAKKRLALMNE
jgi:tetratricopeptide (TPR) repeat protein